MYQEGLLTHRYLYKDLHLLRPMDPTLSYGIHSHSINIEKISFQYLLKAYMDPSLLVLDAYEHICTLLY